MGEGAAADIGLVAAHRQVRELGDEPCDRGHVAKVFAADRVVTELQLEVADYGAEVRVAATLAVSVHAALHLREALFNSRESIRNREVGVVMAVDSERAVETLADFGADLLEARGQCAAVGIAQAENVSPGVPRGLERLEGVG